MDSYHEIVSILGLVRFEVTRMTFKDQMPGGVLFDPIIEGTNHGFRSIDVPQLQTIFLGKLNLQLSFPCPYQPVEELPFNTHKRKRRLECGSDKSR